jgi:hypothetical protein
LILGPRSTQSATLQHSKVQKHKKNILLQYDIARPYITMEAIEKLDLTILPHSPYSRDLAPCNFHLFPKMKEGPSWTSV